MRNLKKFLALVMAMVMAFSLMLTVNAANPVKTFDDKDQITEQFVEAADVLTGMKVFQGDERGFAPSATITRAEVAALIYRLATGDVDNVRAGLYANYGNFKDVNESDWYAGYVGYCANAGYIKGHNGYFSPYGKVTGYEVLAMILRAIGYDKNGEFEGATWQTNVSALATQLLILENIKTTDYGNTLHLASRRDVVAELLFRADAYVPMVVYTTAFGYQQTGMNGGVVSTDTNPTLGRNIFGLALRSGGVVLGNQETGERATVMGYASRATATIATPETPSFPATVATTATNAYGRNFGIQPISFSEYTYAGNYDVTVDPTDTGATRGTATVALGENVKYNVSTGVDVVGHKMHIWYDMRTNNATTGYPVYAYFDDVVLAEVVKVGHSHAGTVTEAQITSMRNEIAANTTLHSAMKAAGFSVNTTTTNAYLNNSYGKFSLAKHSNFDSTASLYTIGTTYTSAGAVDTAGTAVPVEESPEDLYMVVSNNSGKTPDAVISLNLQTSNLTGVDNVNTIKTVTVPYAVGATPAMIDGNDNWDFIDTDNVLTNSASSDGVGGVDGVAGGTLEQKQLVGNSANTLGAKEIGLHITGTVLYNPERTANSLRNGAANNGFERSWFKLTPVTQTHDGVVVAYNNSTVTLSDGTVLEKSIVYDTVVPGTIPQVDPDTYGNDRYENTNYRFYLNDAGKFVGAERVHGSEFIYGTYVDYSQELSSSAFKYFLTGVKLDGTTTTVPVTSLGWSNTQRPVDIASTSRLGVPFRDGGNVGNTTQGIGMGVYRGFSYGSDIANWTFAGLSDIGVVAGANGTTGTNAGTTAPIVVDTNAQANSNVAPTNDVTVPEVHFNGDENNHTDTDPVVIGSRQVTLGAAFAGSIKVGNNTAIAVDTNTTNLYFTENTKFILVSGYGTDSLKTEVYDGISELRGSSDSVSIDFTTTAAAADMNLTHILQTATAGELTYLTQSPFLYAQNQVMSRQADVIILPAEAVTRTGASTIRYVGNATPTMTNSNAVLGREATRFTMYKDGVAEQVWVKGVVDNTDPANTATTGAGSDNRNSATLVAFGNIPNNPSRYHDHFWNLVDTGLKANDGEPIYDVTPVHVTTGLLDASPATAQNTYVASTYSAQTGSFTTDPTITGAAGVTRMLNVSNATITNLNADNPNPIWPGIADLGTLNEAGSLGIYTAPQYGGTQQLKVSFLLAGNSGANQLIVTEIYVCYEQ